MTQAHSILLGLLPAAYVLGSVPFGLIVGLAKGVDPRRAGSGNIGATNVGRLLGGRFFALVFILDLLKSLLPMLAAGWVVRRYATGAAAPTDYLLWIGVGVAAVLGHMFSIFLGFKGGKGVATSAGLLLGIWPSYTLPALLAIGIFIVVFMVWRYVPLASMVAAGAFPLLFVLFARSAAFGAQWPLLAAALLVAGLIVLRHRTNIRRLLDGTEHKFVRKTS